MVCNKKFHVSWKLAYALVNADPKKAITLPYFISRESTFKVSTGLNKYMANKIAPMAPSKHIEKHQLFRFHSPLF